MRSSNRAVAVLAFTVIVNTAALGADPERGRALYENHCQGCHSSTVHNRKQRWPENLEQLRGIVDRWQTEQNLRWSREDIEDVVYFLNVTQYSY
jgi:cytochrome c2